MNLSGKSVSPPSYTVGCCVLASACDLFDIPLVYVVCLDLLTC